ncbi:hypothetical protein QQP08_014116 [Theobroma cacao]|nr:hypothetical protein QQP08_014116 [Theobroma cacao]
MCFQVGGDQEESKSRRTLKLAFLNIDMKFQLHEIFEVLLLCLRLESMMGLQFKLLTHISLSPSKLLAAYRYCRQLRALATLYIKYMNGNLDPQSFLIRCYKQLLKSKGGFRPAAEAMRV